MKPLRRKAKFHPQQIRACTAVERIAFASLQKRQCHCAVEGERNKESGNAQARHGVR